MGARVLGARGVRQNWLAATILTLAGCEADVIENRAPAVELPTFNRIGNDIYAMIIPASFPADRLLDVAKEQCGSAQWCQVHGWMSEREAARAMPMTEPEAESMVFSFSLNRSSGMEQGLWDCRRFQRQDRSQCMATYGREAD